MMAHQAKEAKKANLVLRFPHVRPLLRETPRTLSASGRSHAQRPNQPPPEQRNLRIADVLRSVDKSPANPASERQTTGSGREQLPTSASALRAQEPSPSPAVVRARRDGEQYDVLPVPVRPNQRQVIARGSFAQDGRERRVRGMEGERWWLRRQAAHVDHGAAVCAQPVRGSRSAALFAHDVQFSENKRKR